MGIRIVYGIAMHRPEATVQFFWRTTHCSYNSAGANAVVQMKKAPNPSNLTKAHLSCAMIGRVGVPNQAELVEKTQQT